MVGFIKLHRKLQTWEWYNKSEMVHLFIHLLINANNEDKKWQKIDVKRGQLITGLHSLSEKTGISIRTIRTCLDRLKSTSELTVKTTNKFSIITICKYDDYNDNKTLNDKQNDTQRVTPTTTTKKYKKKEEDNTNSIDADFSSKKSATQILKETFNERKLEFRKTLIPYTKTPKNPNGKYEATMVKDFYDKWTEPNKGLSKMNFELQRTWEVGLRLSNWDRNGFNKPKKVDHKVVDQSNNPNLFV